MKTWSKVVVAAVVGLVVVVSFQNCGVSGTSSSESASNGPLVDGNGDVLIIATPTPTPPPGGGPGPGGTPAPGGGAGIIPQNPAINVAATVGTPFQVTIPFVKTGTVSTTFVRTSSTGLFVVNLARLSINGTANLFFGFVGTVTVVPAGTHVETLTFNAPTAAGTSTHVLRYTIAGVPKDVTLTVTVAP